MKRIVFLGYVVNSEEANSLTGASVAGNKMQLCVVENMAAIENVEMSCVTIVPRATFPYDSQIWNKAAKERLFSGVVSHRISYCNLPVIKQVSQILGMYQTAKKIIRESDADTLLCFNLFPQVGIPMRLLKRKFKGLNTVCLLADLPIDDNTKRKGLAKLLRTQMETSTWKSMDSCDKYVVLNKNVIKQYLPNKQYIVVDGGVSEGDIQKYSDKAKKGGEKNILFCGALTEYNGVLNLIKAMELLEGLDIYLDIYGSGYLEHEVKIAAEKNKSIRYHGRVSNEVVMQKQREAWLLINPRVIDDPIAKVTFPSKTFEYLLSGTPILATKLDAYGEEYNDKMIFADSDTPEKLATSIRNIFNTSSIELEKRGACAKNFVITEKSWKYQTKRIFDFINN